MQFPGLPHIISLSKLSHAAIYHLSAQLAVDCVLCFLKCFLNVHTVNEDLVQGVGVDLLVQCQRISCCINSSDCIVCCQLIQNLIRFYAEECVVLVGLIVCECFI